LFYFLQAHLKQEERVMNKLVCLYLTALMLLFSACQNEEPLAPVNTENPDAEFEMFLCKDGGKDRASITVMTRNVYVGADVDAVLGTLPNDIPFVVPMIYQQLFDTDFEERAQSLAREVRKVRPHLIGLQEIALIRYQEGSDAILGAPPNADSVVFDYLQILLDALEARHLHYRVAGLVQNADVEVPMHVGNDDQGNFLFDDVRLTDFDVVLASKNTKVIDFDAANYGEYLSVFGINVLRGYVSVRAKVDHRKVRFVNTHLEAFDTYYRQKQAEELLGVLQDEELPVIMVGDFNTPAPSDPTYLYILDAGYDDVWLKNSSDRNPDGYTFGHSGDLLNEDAAFYERIDFVFTQNIHRLKVWASVVGDEQWNRTPSGLWPSDHGGVAARIRIPYKHNKHRYARKFD
jgi:endonuclease/exonuclease/phosphatase family metal-dependent hydrolase